MNRRAFVTSAFAVVAAPAAAVAMKPTEKWGAIDVDRHCVLKNKGIDLHVFHNGEDITSRCRYADDVLDYAEVFKVNAQGHKYRDGASVAMEVVRGIEIRRV